MNLFGEPITKFDGTQFAFLSNFWIQEQPILYSVIGGNVRYFVTTVEHAYQADKATNFIDAEKILRASTPAKAKKYGQLIQCRSDWDQIKIGRMRYWLNRKFADPVLGDRLLETGNKLLVEGNTWGDKF